MVAVRKKEMSPWLAALADQGLSVRTATDGLQVQGWLDSGNYALNWAISGRLLRGYPLGHSGEVFGDPSTGKSFLLARALGMAQAAGGVALLDDVEGAYNLGWIDRLGVDPDLLAYERTHTVKEHLDLATGFVKAFRAIKSKGPGIMTCDSIAALSTEHELEVRLEKRDMSKAAEIKAFFRVMGSDIADLPIVYLAANHIIDQPGNFFQPRTTPGGRGAKFHSSFRLDLRSVSKIKADGHFTGVICRIVVEKTRFTAPWKEVRLAIPFFQPVSQTSGLIPLLVQLGILGVTSGRNSSLTLDGDDTGILAHTGKGAFLKQDHSAVELLDLYPDLLEQVDQRLVEKDATILQGWEEGEISGGETRSQEGEDPEEIEE